MKGIVTLFCSTLLIASCFNSYAQEDLVNFTLDANEPITGCRIVALRDSDGLGKVESITGSHLNLRIHKDNVYKITINDKKTYYLQHDTHTGFAQVDGVKISSADILASMVVSSDEAAASDPGLKFRVQIGAFSKDVSIYPFKRLGPLYTEKIEGGITRYMVGSYASHDQAAEVVEKIKSMGYTEAFAVVCYDGKRISFSEAEEWSAQNLK